MSSAKGSSSQTFLRGIESDLRALCADARRRNPEVKAAAERVILQLKEADHDDALNAAADAAAVAFCAACEAPADNAGTATVQAQKKVIARAVSCLHKLVTHQALSPSLLSSILDAIERLGMASLDDNITLKVLQTNISLLSVRQYTRSLSEDELARAFSLFFKLKTLQGTLTPVSNASTALSAISQITAVKEDGVIELTARAAFRQVAAYLFSAAADSTQQRGATDPITSATPLESNPIEVRASYRLFQDLCALLAGNRLLWLSDEEEEGPVELNGLEDILILEVVDDALSDNVLLFRKHPLFADLIAQGLAPAIYKKIVFDQEKPLLKALLSLSSTLLKSFWEELGPNCKSLLRTISSKARVQGPGTPGWTCLYSLEALRCIFSAPEGSNLLSRFIHAYDLGEEPSPVVASILSAVCDVLDMHESIDFHKLPSAPMVGSSKPFGSVPFDTSEVMLSIALGLFISIGNGIQYASLAGDLDAVRIFASQELSMRLVQRGGDIIKTIPVPSTKLSDHQAELWKVAIASLLNALTSFGSASYSANVSGCFDQTLASLSSVCVSALAESGSPDASGVSSEFRSFRVLRAYKSLLLIQETCGERLGRNWTPVLNAIAPLDEKIFAVLTPSQLLADENAIELHQELKAALQEVFSSARKLSWNAVHDLISALIHSSRASIQAMSKKSADDAAVSEASGTIRVFGITWAEFVFSSVLGTARGRDDVMPQGLWILLSGHLVSVAVDSEVEYLRSTALKALTSVASAAFSCEVDSFIPHGKVISPFLDSLRSPYAGTRLGTLESIHHLLQTHGDRISGVPAWGAVLSILLSACGSKDRPLEAKADGSEEEKQDMHNGSATPTSSTEALVTDGFRVVQLLADDFLSCLVEEVLPRWIYVLGGYGRQTEDVNVALTSIGLLWRTADFMAKSRSLGGKTSLWITLFSELKDLGLDERPEVRNCAVKTLTGTLTAHAGDLSAVAWEGCIAKALLPLLENVMKGGETPKGVPEDTATSSRNKPDPNLIVHHSRNTPRKQWNETKVLSLTGVASVLGIAIPLLANLQGVDGRPILLLLADDESGGLWGKMLQLARTAAASQDSEVAVAGVASLLDLLSASGVTVSQSIALPAESVEKDQVPQTQPPLQQSTSSPTIAWIADLLVPEDVKLGESVAPPSATENGPQPSESNGAVSLWEAVWKAIAAGVCSSDDKVGSRPFEPKMQITNGKALVLLAKGMAKDETHLNINLSQRSSPYLVQVLFNLITSENIDSSQGGIPRYASHGLSDVVSTALNAVRLLRFGEDVSSWKCLLESLLLVLQGHSTVRKRPVLAFNIVTILKEFYNFSDIIPATVLNSLLSETVLGLGVIMNERHEEDSENSSADAIVHDEMPLWSAATVAFQSAMQVVSRFPHAPSSLWESVWKVLNNFLYPFKLLAPAKKATSMVFSLPDPQEYDILMARTIRDFLPFLEIATPHELRTKLVGLLVRGAEESKQSDRQRFVRACQEYIFNLADQRWASTRSGLAKNDIANICAMQVTQMSDQILALFIADGQRSGRCPLPAERRAEVVFLLRKLRSLQAFHSETNGDAQGGKKHMLTLYPRLAECVDIGDVAVRNFARLLIDESAAIR